MVNQVSLPNKWVAEVNREVVELIAGQEVSERQLQLIISELSINEELSVALESLVTEIIGQVIGEE
jgi:hypothetical protein